MNTLTVRRALLLLAAGLTLAAQAATDPALAPEPAFDAAWSRFAQAGRADSAVDAAVTALDALARQAPDDLLVGATLGAATAMQARTTLLPWRKMSRVEDGLALIDKALARLTPAHDAPGHRGTPTSLEVRFMAASTFLGLPEMFNRHARGERLLAEVMAHPAYAGAPQGFRNAVAARAAQAALATSTSSAASAATAGAR